MAHDNVAAQDGGEALAARLQFLTKTRTRLSMLANAKSGGTGAALVRWAPFLSSSVGRPPTWGRRR